MYLPRKKPEMASEDDIGKYWDMIRGDIAFNTRGRKYGTVEVGFASEQVVYRHPTVPLWTEE